MIPDIVVPPHIPESSAEAYKEFCLAQQIQGLLAKHKVSRASAAAVLSYVLGECLLQVRHPVAASQLTIGLLEMVDGKVQAFCEHLSLDPVIRVKMNTTDKIARRMAMQAELREPVVVSIDESAFKVPGAEGGAPAPASTIIVPH